LGARDGLRLMDARDRDRRWLWAALALVLPVLAVAGLFPFAFAARNEVSWVVPGPGLDFRARSLAVSEAAILLGAGEGLSLELWVAPAHAPTRRLGVMASLFDGRAPAPLLIAQWKSNLVVRMRDPAAREARAHREIGFHKVLGPGSLHHVTVVSGAGGTRAFVDGREAPSQVAGSIVPPDEALEARLVLGNSAAATEPWSGRIVALALFDRALSAAEVASHGQRFERDGAKALAGQPGLSLLYAFDEAGGPAAAARAAAGRTAPAIVIEPVLRPLERVVLSPARTAFAGQARDLLLNILGFVPLGWIVMLLAGRSGKAWRAILVATAAGVLVSLSIEFAQVWLPGRVSSLIDLLCNSAGAALGGVLALPWWRGRSVPAEAAQGDPHTQ